MNAAGPRGPRACSRRAPVRAARAADRQSLRAWRGVRRTRPARGLAVTLLPPAGEWNDAQRLAEQPAQALAGLKAIHARHADVEQHGIWPELLRKAKAGRPVVRDLRACPEALQQHRHGVRRIHVVIDDENAPVGNDVRLLGNGRGRGIATRRGGNAYAEAAAAVLTLTAR